LGAWSQALISVRDGTRPVATTVPSITRAGVPMKKPRPTISAGVGDVARLDGRVLDPRDVADALEQLRAASAAGHQDLDGLGHQVSQLKA
jgi:hypothetical protein